MDQDRMGRIILELSRKKSLEQNDPEQKKIELLTPRERDIVMAVTSRAGATGSDIAKDMHVSESTLRNHLSSVYAKLEISNKLELWDYAHKHGLTKGAKKS